MTCPKCGLKREMDDRICRGCKYFFEEDRFVSLEPPRRGSAADRAVATLERGAVRVKRGLPIVGRAALGIIPGVGHILTGRLNRGLALLGIWAALVALSVATFTSMIGQVLLGLAIAVHAYSICDLIPWRETHGPIVRACAMAASLVVLSLVYWPFMIYLAFNVIYADRVNRGRAFGGVQFTRDQLLWMVILFVVSLAVSIHLSRRRERD